MDLLVSVHALPTPASWERLLRDFALQWKRSPLIHLHLRGSGESLQTCLTALEDLTACQEPVRIADLRGGWHTYQIERHLGVPRLEGVYVTLWLERVDE